MPRPLTERESIQAALAEAEAAREDLEAQFEVAKQALFSSVRDASLIDSNREQAAEKVEKARARCRELRELLEHARHDREETSEKLATVLRRVSKPAQRSGSPAQRRPPEQRAPLQRPVKRWKKWRIAADTLRQSVGLLALVLTYLLYYFLDCNLEALELPVAFPTYFPPDTPVSTILSADFKPR